MAAPAPSPALLRLKACLDGALAGLPGVEQRRIFGSEGCFVGGRLFAILFLREARLGLRFAEAEARAELLACPGAEAWVLGQRPMGPWVLLPEAWHRQPARLKPWLARAFEAAAARPPKASASRRRGHPQVRAARFPRIGRPR